MYYNILASPFIQQTFIKHLMCTSTVLGTRDSAVNKKEKILDLMEHGHWWKEDNERDK